MIASEELKWKAEEILRDYFKFTENIEQRRIDPFLYKAMEEIINNYIQKNCYQIIEFYNRLYNSFVSDYPMKGSVVNGLEIVRQDGTYLPRAWCSSVDNEV